MLVVGLPAHLWILPRVVRSAFPSDRGSIERPGVDLTPDSGHQTGRLGLAGASDGSADSVGREHCECFDGIDMNEMDKFGK